MPSRMPRLHMRCVLERDTIQKLYRLLQPLRIVPMRRYPKLLRLHRVSLQLLASGVSSMHLWLALAKSPAGDENYKDVT